MDAGPSSNMLKKSDSQRYTIERCDRKIRPTAYQNLLAAARKIRNRLPPSMVASVFTQIIRDRFQVLMQLRTLLHTISILKF